VFPTCGPQYGDGLIRQFLRYPPGTQFMELKVIMHHRIGRPNADIQFFCTFVYRHSSVLKNQFSSSFFILCGCGCGWMARALCIKGPIHDQSCCAKMFWAAQGCPWLTVYDADNLHNLLHKIRWAPSVTLVRPFLKISIHSYTTLRERAFSPY
jgi:hypothetical protein